MAINIKNFLISKDRKSKIGDFQDLDHIDGVALSVVSADLYKDPRDDLVLFYFREGANYASVYTQSKIISENIKWNLSLKGNTIKAMLVNTRNANAFTGKQGEETVLKISKHLAVKLNCNINQIYTASTGVIGEQIDPDMVIRSIKSMFPLKNLDWVKAATAIDFRGDNMLNFESLEKNSIDLYAATKSLYLQDRSKKIKNTTSSDDESWGDLDK